MTRRNVAAHDTGIVHRDLKPANIKIRPDGLVATAKLKPTSLTGTWRVTEAKTTGPNASTNSSPQPGLYIFTGDHYSIVTVTSQTPRPDAGTAPQDNANATAAQLLAAWGPFTANSGTYEISGGNVTFHPAVAKNPGVMAPRATNVSSFKIEGNKLTLVQVRATNGRSRTRPPRR